MNNVSMISIARWILRIIATVLAVLVCWYVIRSLYIFSVSGMILTTMGMVAHLLYLVVVIGLVLFWFNEIWSGIIILIGLFIMLIVGALSSGQITLDWYYVSFVILGVIFTTFGVLSKKRQNT